jgi:hypothetical protein
MNLKSDAIISNGKGETPGGTSHIYFNIAGVAVLCNVVEGFLNNSKKGKCYVIVQLCRDVRAGGLDLDRVLLREFATKLCDGNCKAKVLELGRVQSVGYTADVKAYCCEAFAEFLHPRI